MNAWQNRGLALTLVRIQIRSRRLSIVLAVLCLLPAYAHNSVAKDWDLDRGQYVTDTARNDFHGPVREAVVQRFEGGKPTSVATKSFDGTGNLIRDQAVSQVDRSCTDVAHTYDARGNRLTDASSVGQIPSGNVSCVNLTLTLSFRYDYTFGPQGELVTRRATNTLAASPSPGTTSKYTYDPAGRQLARMDSSRGNVDMWSEAYSYRSDQQGLWVNRHFTASFSNGQIKYDVVRDILFGARDRLLKVIQTPPDVFGVSSLTGDEVLSYSPSGNLVERQLGNVTTKLSGHDQYGNWTDSLSSTGVRVARQIKY